jgi:hypothetical protein
MRPALAVMVLALAAGSACSQPARAPADSSSRQTRVPGEYIVTLAEGAKVGAIVDLYGRFGIKGTRGLGSNQYVVTFSQDPGQARLEELRSGSAQIKAVQPNFIYRAR